MKAFFLLLILTSAMISCNKDDIANGTPDCIVEKIHDFKNTCCDNDANVKEYLFQGATVYVFNPGTCGADMTSEVTNSQCTTLGYLGGIAGNVAINGENFSSASLQRTIWKN